MSTLTARDLMTTELVTVPPETPVIAMARLLADRGISAVPVLAADGALLGLVTEADLIRRLAGEEDKPASWFSGLFGDPASGAEHYARTHGAKALDIMTEKLITVEPDATAAHVAQVMEEHGIRRVLVVSQGRLRGLISRADLLHALLLPPEKAEGIPDERIRAGVIAAMRKEPWADTYYIMVDVKDGAVTFHGFSRSDAIKRGLRVLAEGVPGVKSVTDETQPLPMYLYAAS
ncbi:MAG: CBS domain-containing protein [Alphaproteobacteria bacterium]|jgi:CBS domain-containing protein